MRKNPFIKDLKWRTSTCKHLSIFLLILLGTPNDVIETGY